MVATPEWMQQVRDKTHNLDLNLLQHKEIYDRLLEETLMQNELKCNNNGKPIFDKIVYLDDAKIQNRTIGVGFNMDGLGAKQQWRRAFGDRISRVLPYR